MVNTPVCEFYYDLHYAYHIIYHHTNYQRITLFVYSLLWSKQNKQKTPLWMLSCHFLNGNYKVLSSKIYMVTVSYAYFW